MGLPPQDYFNFEKRFLYVDVRYDPGKGSKIPAAYKKWGHAWRRIKIDELENFAKECKFHNVFATIQQFCVHRPTKDEEQYAPLYFDFDSNGDFKKVQEDVDRLIHYFATAHDLGKAQRRIYFSGKRGMHVIINPISLGVTPHPELTYIFKNIAFYLQSLLHLSTLDPGVYTTRRMLRLPNSVHRDSGCYKIELDANEILMPEEEIRKLAKAPREPFYEASEFIDLSPNESLQILYNNFCDIYHRQTEINKLKPQKLIKQTDIYPACIKDLLENGIAKAGYRNKATLCLACYCKDQGWSEESAFNLIWDWVQKIPTELTSAKGNVLKASTQTCIKSIYGDQSIKKDYHFICSVIKQLDVKCDGDKCIITKEEDQEPEKIIKVELSEASDGIYIHKKLDCRVMVVGKDTSPFLTPSRVSIECASKGGPDMTKEGSPCVNCKIQQKGNKYTFDLPVESFVLETINCTTQQQLALLKKLYCANPRCPRATVKIEETRNIEEVELNPGIDMRKDDMGSEYVARRGYYVGHKLDVNQDFNILGYVIADPKTQHAVHLFDEAKPAETSLSAFKMTKAIEKELSIFKIKEKQTMKEKLHEIYTDLERNILHIWERKSMLIAMDLVYHSVLRFKFQGSLLQRGWVEGFIIGDSGQAKCILSGCYITTYDGLKKIEDICSERKKGARVPLNIEVASLKGKEKTSHFYVNGLSDTYKIISKRGFEIEGTPNHPLLVLNNDGNLEFRKLKDLCKNDYFAIARGHNLWGKKKLKKEEARLLGYLIADGWIGHNVISIHKLYQIVKNDIIHCLEL